jgi:hypothetical protein
MDKFWTHLHPEKRQKYFPSILDNNFRFR